MKEKEKRKEEKKEGYLRNQNRRADIVHRLDPTLGEHPSLEPHPLQFFQSFFDVLFPVSVCLTQFENQGKTHFEPVALQLLHRLLHIRLLRHIVRFATRREQRPQSCQPSHAVSAFSD